MCLTGRDSAITVTEECLIPMGAGMPQGGPIGRWVSVCQDPWAIGFKQYSSTQVWKSLNCIQLFATPWTIVYQAPLSMAFSRPEYWSGSCSLLQGILQPRDRIQAAHAAGRFFTIWATRETQELAPKGRHYLKCVNSWNWMKSYLLVEVVTHLWVPCLLHPQ